jgi:RimJ/RimL family protein N-acetyltransferase
MSEPQLETDRLLLRQPRDEDTAAIAEQMGDPDVMRYIGHGDTGTFEHAVAYVRRMQRAWSLDGFGRFVVVRKADGVPVGRAGLLAWDPDVWRSGTRAEIGPHAEVELGWTLARAAWGHGYATEAAIAARDWALHDVRPSRLVSLIHPENERSQRVARRLGERVERAVTTHRGVPAELWTFKSPNRNET